MTESNLIPLAIAPSVIRQETGRAIKGGYRKLYSLILSGQLNAVKNGARWFIDRSEIPGILAIAGA